MKRKLLYSAFLLLCAHAQAQEVQYRALTDSTRHLVSLQAGADYSINYGAAYGYVFHTPLGHVVAGTELQLPCGSQVLDDWKWRTGFQTEVWHCDLLSFAVKPAFIARRYETTLARMFSLGADVSLTFGIVRPKWGIVALANYDKSFATHLQHGELKTYYPEIRDGWYGASGGNFKFGLRGQLSVQSWNLFLTAGKHYAQNFRDNPTLPFFAEISVQRQFGK